MCLISDKILAYHSFKFTNAHTFTFLFFYLQTDPSRRITIPGILDHPWFNKDLPPGVKQMNDNMRMPPSGSQSEQEVRAVVAAAQRNTTAGHPAWEDDYIDDTMDAENYDSPYEDVQ